MKWQHALVAVKEIKTDGMTEQQVGELCYDSRSILFSHVWFVGGFFLEDREIEGFAAARGNGASIVVTRSYTSDSWVMCSVCPLILK